MPIFTLSIISKELGSPEKLFWAMNLQTVWKFLVVTITHEMSHNSTMCCRSNILWTLNIMFKPLNLKVMDLNIANVQHSHTNHLANISAFLNDENLSITDTIMRYKHNPYYSLLIYFHYSLLVHPIIVLLQIMNWQIMKIKPDVL